MYGECFKCGVFLEWAEKSPESFSFTVEQIAVDDVNATFGSRMEDVEPYTMKFSGVVWGRRDHTTETSSACSGYGRFSAEILEDDSGIHYLNGAPGFGEGI